MTAMMELEQMGYRFRLDGDKVLMRRYYADSISRLSLDELKTLAGEQ